MLTLAAWLHDISPFIWRISDTFGIRWYGVAYLTGFAVAYLILVRLARRGLTLIPADRVGDAMLWLIGGTLLGGRMGYVIFYQPALAMTWFDRVPFWGVLAINEGGMSSHGGMIGLTFACWRISRGWPDQTGRTVGRAPLLHVMDMVALVAPFGVFFGRIANFINGELLAKIVTPPGVEGPWWAVQYPQELDLPNTSQIPVFSGAFPQKAAELSRMAMERSGGDSLGLGLHRLATDFEHVAQLKPYLASRHPSQLYQAFAEGVVIAVVLWVLWLRPRKTGVLTAVFFITYGVLRIITEIWRLPDAHLKEGRPFGLSRGQWLSVAMIAVGVAVLTWIRTRALPRFGGWLKMSDHESSAGGHAV